MVTHPEPIEAGRGDVTAPSAEPRSGRAALLYLLPIVAFPLLLLASALLVIPSRWFALRSGNTYLANLGYGASLSGQNCQVLIFGDSTALVGVDPAIIHARTGLTTCNIAEFAGVTLASGTLPVDSFLKRNSPPRDIVFVYAPENLARPAVWGHVSMFEAITERIQHEPNWETVKVLAGHPIDVLIWAEQGMRMAALRVFAPPMPISLTTRRAHDGGQLKVEGPAATRCDDKDVREYPPDPAWVQSLRTRYAHPGTRVIVDATPAMDCDKGLPYYRQHITNLIDDRPFPVYPVGDFLNADGMRMHMNAHGAERLSNLIADQIVGNASGGR